MIDHWQGFELQLAEIDYQHDRINTYDRSLAPLKPYQLEPQNLKHVEVIDVSDKPT